VWVSDVDGRRRAGNERFVVLPAALCVALRGPSTALAPGSEFSVDAQVTDWEGTAVVGAPFEVEVSSSDGVVDRVRAMSGSTPTRLSFTAPDVAALEVRAWVEDGEGRVADTFLDLSVGHDYSQTLYGRTESALVTPAGELREAGPGRARLQLNPRNLPAEALVVVDHCGLESWRRARVERDGRGVEIAIREAHAPSVRIHTLVVETCSFTTCPAALCADAAMTST
jgi:hypothetical protein